MNTIKTCIVFAKINLPSSSFSFSNSFSESDVETNMKSATLQKEYHIFVHICYLNGSLQIAENLKRNKTLVTNQTEKIQNYRSNNYNLVEICCEFLEVAACIDYEF